MDGDILDTTAQKTRQRKEFPLQKTPCVFYQNTQPHPDEDDPRIFPKISNQNSIHI